MGGDLKMSGIYRGGGSDERAGPLPPEGCGEGPVLPLPPSSSRKTAQRPEDGELGAGSHQLRLLSHGPRVPSYFQAGLKGPRSLLPEGRGALQHAFTRGETG